MIRNENHSPVLYIIIPCYNEEEVLPQTHILFLSELKNLISKNKISDDSRILFCDDCSSDSTWDLIMQYSKKDKHFAGIRQSRNFGHQGNLLGGLMEAKNKCDISISIDCDGQDSICAMEKMVDDYAKGSEVVYGVRSSRRTDSFFKRFTAQGFYRLMNKLGANIVYNHADYRLLSNKVLAEMANFREVNLFLRGLVPLVGFKSSCVYYERKERVAGRSHYPLRKMLALAFNGITSLSIQPIRTITCLGCFMSIAAFIAMLFYFFRKILSPPSSLRGWSSMVCVLFFLGGLQLLSLGIIGEYIGKIYLETKARPRFIISERIGEF